MSQHVQPWCALAADQENRLRRTVSPRHQPAASTGSKKPASAIGRVEHLVGPDCNSSVLKKEAIIEGLKAPEITVPGFLFEPSYTEFKVFGPGDTTALLRPTQSL